MSLLFLATKEVEKDIRLIRKNLTAFRKSCNQIDQNIQNASVELNKRQRRKRLLDCSALLQSTIKKGEGLLKRSNDVGLAVTHLNRQNTVVQNELESLSQQLAIEEEFFKAVQEVASARTELRLAQLKDKNTIRARKELLCSAEEYLQQVVGCIEGFDEEGHQELLDLLHREAKFCDNYGDESATSCVVCIEKPRNTILLPCAHVCLCQGCSVRVKDCPMCRAFVEKSHRVFLN
jgi:hypothetical protein